MNTPAFQYTTVSLYGKVTIKSVCENCLRREEKCKPNGMRNWVKLLTKYKKVYYCVSMELNIPQKYRRDIEVATNLLKNEGCKSIYLFGSLITGKPKNDSDIDIGIKGFPKGKYFEICAKVYFALDNDIDIVDFDNNEDFYSLLNRLGEVIELG